MMLRDGCVLAAAGLAMSRFIESFLFETKPNDPDAVAISAAILRPPLAAGYGLAWPASRVDRLPAARMSAAAVNSGGSAATCEIRLTFNREHIDQPAQIRADTYSDTGESQGRLPGADAARQAGIADTTFKAPQQESGWDFSLEPEETPTATARRQADEQPGLGALAQRKPERLRSTRAYVAQELQRKGLMGMTAR
jgi:hypothetical protein